MMSKISVTCIRDSPKICAMIVLVLVMLHHTLYNVMYFYMNMNLHIVPKSTACITVK